MWRRSDTHAGIRSPNCRTSLNKPNNRACNPIEIKDKPQSEKRANACEDRDQGESSARCPVGL
jgi:hypothetical protein